MELWQFNACITEYNRLQGEKRDIELSICWQTAAFIGAAFAGKLRKLESYKLDENVGTAPKVSKEEFEEKLARAGRRES